MRVTLVITMIIRGQPSMLTSEILNVFGLLIAVAFLRNLENLPSGGLLQLTIHCPLNMKRIARSPPILTEQNFRPARNAAVLRVVTF
jgi:hypothetical protein